MGEKPQKKICTKSEEYKNYTESLEKRKKHHI